MTAQSDTVYRRAYHTAVNLLAVRDHSSVELTRKLRQRYADLTTDDLERVFAELERSGYLSNERFAQSYARSLVNRGQGPLKILYGLREKGIPDELAKAALVQVETDEAIDWTQVASELRARKFGEHLPNDFKERARQSRFLAGRGFNLDSINAVFHEKC
ncbi:MAG: regulatory protein RecX [Thiofilum sp.]|uniref:regulatory protein RecX n=1 Tax=Thiofilum sp. TaxID=2212733 RepID=UPI0025DFC4DD|nr:regulatory protein RecX [Thiofilum sp.]MBK8453532.1 regulatory protein RecX [Thiofilum sp.]